MRVLALVPAYNEGEAVSGVVRGVFGYISDVLVVDDGSTDDTAAEAAAAGAKVVRFERNCGKGAALKAGFDAAREMGFTHVLTLDADGQHDPGDIPLFIQEAEKSDADIVLGSRMADLGSMPCLRRMSNRVSSRLISKVAGQRIRDSQSGYRLLKVQSLDRMAFRATRYEAESEMLISAACRGLRIVEVPIKTIYGAEKSKYRTLRDTIRFFWAVFLTYLRTKRSPSRSRRQGI